LRADDLRQKHGLELGLAQPGRPRSPPLRALAKAANKHTPDALPVHSFGSLLADLATICLNTIAPADPALPAFRLVTTPLSSAKLSTCSVSATASGSCSQQPARRNPKSQVNGHPRGSPGELRLGLTVLRGTCPAGAVRRGGRGYTSVRH